MPPWYYGIFITTKNRYICPRQKTRTIQITDKRITMKKPTYHWKLIIPVLMSFFVMSFIDLVGTGVRTSGHLAG